MRKSRFVLSPMTGNAVVDSVEAERPPPAVVVGTFELKLTKMVPFALLMTWR